MREILFEGKRKDNGEWIEGYFGVFVGIPQIYVPFTEEQKKENEGHIFSQIGGLWYEVIPETVGQYTGLTDKNGKKIFEGYIVTNSYGRKETVEFYKGRYYPFIAFPEYKCWDEKECEVIGNIHDNPELMKG